MSEVKSVTPEELEEIKAIQNDYLATTYDIGQLYVDQKTANESLGKIEREIEQAFQSLKEIKRKEADLSKKLQEKYGSSTIDLSTGILVS